VSANPPPRPLYRPRGGQQLPSVGPSMERRGGEELLTPGIFLGLDGDLGRMVEKVWNDERRALRRGRATNELYE